MRQELKDFDWHVSGLHLWEFDETIEFINEILSDRLNQLQEKSKKTTVYDQDGNELTDEESGYNEAIDDLNYYTWLDNLFLYQFGLWRLQAIFEGILRQEFFPEKELAGLKKKLDKVREMGYSVTSDDYNELIEWGKLRNALSHLPTEKYRPTPLDKEDIIEYKEVVKKIATDLLRQKNEKTNK